MRILRTIAMTGVVLTLAASISGAARAQYTTTINPATNWGTWQGWGTSLAWWANVYGTRTDIASALWTLNSTSVTSNMGTQTLPGLGLNVARYNVGGTSTLPITVGGTVYTPNNPSGLAPFKEIQTYWLDWNSSNPTSSSWNWNNDSNQRNALWNARNDGANIFQLFSNSPPWWMCYDSSTTGNTNGSSDNLQSWNYDTFAVYLANVAQQFNSNWGITFQSVEPFNEPMANWWQYPSGGAAAQEGCHFAYSTQNSVIGYLRTELNSRGLNSMGIASSDENTVDQALSTWNNLTTTSRGNLSEINTHGYQYGSGNRVGLYNAAHNNGKALWDSEYAESDGTGMSLASNLNLDMRWLHPTVWCYWQALDSGGWGLIASNPGDNWMGFANTKYYVLAQYTRYIRPGMTMIDSGDGNTIAAYNSSAHQLVLVTTNYGTAQYITYDLSKYGTVAGNSGGEIDRWDTVTGGGDMLTYHADTYLSGKKFWSWFPANTVQTFVVNNIY